MIKKLFLGDEAVAQAAIDAGLSGLYAYPGTPSTEIMEYVQESRQAVQRNIHRKWSVNEKTAMEEAIGLSYVGKRTMVCMKHVGLNVAADPFMNSAISGVNGGMIVFVADDPSMHSSQNEQDSRYYGRFAKIPVFEPSSQQEAYDMVFEAFDLSEKYRVPVMLRMTTRLSHSRAGVVLRDVPMDENSRKTPTEPQRYVLLPAIAIRQYKRLLEIQKDIKSESETSRFNRYFEGKYNSLGIIACGIGYNYVREAFNGDVPYPVIKVDQYPLPEVMIRNMAATVERILVVEEGYPFVEEQMLGVFHDMFPLSGKLDGTFPSSGELTPEMVAKALGRNIETSQKPSELVVPRPPAPCKGCGHIDVFNCLNTVMKDVPEGAVFSDIGCYTLGALPPYKAIATCIDMGASITMAKGASDGGLPVAISLIGDSTFTHSGMTGLLDAVLENTPITVCISDNKTTGMTGGQTSAATDRIENICLGIGVNPDHLKVLDSLPKNLEANVAVLKEEIAYRGLSVIVFRRECVRVAARKAKSKAK